MSRIMDDLDEALCTVSRLEELNSGAKFVVTTITPSGAIAIVSDDAQEGS